MTFHEIHDTLFGESEHHLVICFNREDFEAYASKGLDPNKAYIEIYSGPLGRPILKSESDNVIFMDFEDYPENVRFPNSRYQPTNPTITHEQAERLVLFIDKHKNLGHDFVVHCDAGVSRSQQVSEYILLVGGLHYCYDENLSSHSHHFSSTVVLSRLLQAKHRILPSFNNRDGSFYYDRVTDSWIQSTCQS